MHDGYLKTRGRLPDKTTFATSYDAKKKLWSAVMTIPIGSGEVKQFAVKKSGLFGSLSALDKMYRVWYLATFGKKAEDEPNIEEDFLAQRTT